MTIAKWNRQGTAGRAFTIGLLGIVLGLTALAGCGGGDSSPGFATATTRTTYVNNTGKDVYMYDSLDLTQNGGKILVPAHSTVFANEGYQDKATAGTVVDVTKHVESLDGTSTAMVTVHNVAVAGGKTESVMTTWDGATLVCTAAAHPQ